jgi:putative FmdB family regulatory protein
MPTYEYQCTQCGHEFEREQRITEEPVQICPSCEASGVKRLISATSFVLKGSGWYSDLYSSGGKKKSDAGDKGTCPAAESKAPCAESCPAASGSDGKKKSAAA